MKISARIPDNPKPQLVLAEEEQSVVLHRFQGSPKKSKAEHHQGSRHRRSKPEKSAREQFRRSRPGLRDAYSLSPKP
ncbi:hypothetical protein U1Q18_018109 [Sarracenia purpurea var. burkii]